MFTYVRKMILEFADVEASFITEKTYFISDLQLTSYDIVTMIGKIEDELGVEIPDREIRDLETVGDLVAYLNERMP